MKTESAHVLARIIAIGAEWKLFLHQGQKKKHLASRFLRLICLHRNLPSDTNSLFIFLSNSNGFAKGIHWYSYAKKMG